MMTSLLPMVLVCTFFFMALLLSRFSAHVCQWLIASWTRRIELLFADIGKTWDYLITDPQLRWSVCPSHSLIFYL